MHVISGLETGGAETSLVQVACELQRRGHSQYVVSLRSEGAYADELRRSGVELNALNVAGLLQVPAGLHSLSRLIRRHQPTAIQGWMYHGNLMAAVAHRFTAGRSIRRLLWNLRASNMDAARYGRLVRYSAALSGWPDIVIANSRAGEAFHAAHGHRSRRTQVIVNGIDTLRFRPDPQAREQLRAEFGIPMDVVVAIHPARVDPMKDHETFLKAMHMVPGIFAVMVGARTVTLKSLPNVRSLGLRRDIERLYPLADIVMSTSAFGEGFSNALAEGMSAGLVPIATDVGDSRLIVGNMGYITEPRDAQALAQAMSQVAGFSPAERVAMGARARDRIVEQFSIEKAVGEYERLYSSLALARYGH